MYIPEARLVAATEAAAPPEAMAQVALDEPVTAEEPVAAGPAGGSDAAIRNGAAGPLARYGRVDAAAGAGRHSGDGGGHSRADEAAFAGPRELSRLEAHRPRAGRCAASARRWRAAIVHNRRIDPAACIPDKRTDLLPKGDDLRVPQTRSTAMRSSWGTNARWRQRETGDRT